MLAEVITGAPACCHDQIAMAVAKACPDQPLLKLSRQWVHLGLLEWWLVELPQQQLPDCLCLSQVLIGRTSSGAGCSLIIGACHAQL